MSDTEEPEERIDEPYIQWKAENQRNENDYISSRWSQLYSLEEEWGKEAVKYIILLNSGGAVATLGFIGTAGAANVPTQAKVALAFFVGGIVLGGVMVAHINHTVSTRFDNWRAGVKRYRQGGLNYEQLCEHDEGALDYDSDEVDRSLGYAAFACFILGCGIGAYGLFASPNGKNQALLENNAPAMIQAAPQTPKNVNLHTTKIPSDQNGNSMQ